MAENTKKWEETGRRYRTYIKLEKRLSEYTVESYMRDLRQFAHFILRQYDVTPRKVERTMIERYMGWLFERGREKTSQARCLCGIRSFFNFLLISDQIEASARATSSGWCRSAPSHATRYSAISKSAAAHVRAKRSYSSTTGAGSLRA